MGTNKWYSDSEEFLEGVETGIDFAGDSAVTSKGVTESDNTEYHFMLVTTDEETNESWNIYFSGSAENYRERVSS